MWTRGIGSARRRIRNPARSRAPKRHRRGIAPALLTLGLANNGRGHGRHSLHLRLCRSANVPSEMVLQWNITASWEHRAYWGANTISMGTDAPRAAILYAGPNPRRGQWVQLQVPASAVRPRRQQRQRMAFSLYMAALPGTIPGKALLLPMALAAGTTGGTGGGTNGSSGSVTKSHPAPTPR